MVTEAKRRNNNKWDAANMTVMSCKITNAKASEFRLACKLAGTTPNAVFRRAADDLIEHVKAGGILAPDSTPDSEAGKDSGQG